MTRISGWGRFPTMEAQVIEPVSAEACARALAEGTPVGLRGLGRSYGDSALAERVLGLRRMDHLLAFDTATGRLTCEAGVSLDELLRFAVPRGWFLPVLPGTRHVTVGGAIASDVHGKNHHRDGTFCAHVESMALLTGRGEQVEVTPGDNADLFRATCGGMGLTGIVLRATLRLRRIAGSDIVEETRPAANLAQLIDEFGRAQDAPYSVGWIDSTASGAALGRGLLMLGAHAPDGDLQPHRPHARRVPVDLPAAWLNRSTARAFNAAYRLRGHRRAARRVPYGTFFHPLDGLADWNRLYGRQGLVQYQFALPDATATEGMREVLAAISASGEGSFLAVLKRFGPANDNLLSFPLAGLTLALDFKAEPAVFALLDRLDAMVLHHGGRIYLAKDARMSQDTFRRGYPQWERFEAVRARWGAAGRFASAQSRRLGLA